MIETMVLTTGWLFWAIVGVIVLFDVLALSSEDDGLGGWAIFLTVTGLVLATAFTDAFVGIKLTWLAVGIFGYCLLGVIWSFKKWIDFVKEQKLKHSGRADYRPDASREKMRIVTSMALWPFQFTWWVMTWPRHFFTWAYNRLVTVCDRLTQYIWEKV